MSSVTQPESGPKPDMSAFAHVRHPQLVQFLGHYLNLRHNRRAPSRNQISPLDFPKLLSSVFLYEYDKAVNDFRMRLAGNVIAEMLQTVKAGSLLSQVFPPDAHHVMTERYRKVCFEYSVMHNIGNVFHQVGGTGIGERIVVPLLDEQDQPNFFLGATMYPLPDDTPRPRHAPNSQVVTFTPL